MTIMTVTTRVTYKYLMNKSKHDLAHMVLDVLDDADRLLAKVERLEAENQTYRAYLNSLGIVTIVGDNKTSPYPKGGKP